MKHNISSPYLKYATTPAPNTDIKTKAKKIKHLLEVWDLFAVLGCFLKDVFLTTTPGEGGSEDVGFADSGLGGVDFSSGEGSAGASLITFFLRNLKTENRCCKECQST